MSEAVQRCNFVVGQKVVCVKGWPAHMQISGYLTLGLRFPEEGGVYTVRSVFVFEEVVCVHLEEIINPVCQYIEVVAEQGFDATRFRPVEPRKTDISQFKALLNPESAKEFVWAD